MLVSRDIWGESVGCLFCYFLIIENPFVIDNICFCLFYAVLFCTVMFFFQKLIFVATNAVENIIL